MREVNKQDLETRRAFSYIIVLLFFVVLIYGFTKLQVVKSDFYSQKSLNNSVRKVTTLPVRGVIFDRKGRILVDNNASFYVSVIPKVIKDSTLVKLTTLLSLDYDKTKKLLRKQYGYRPVVIMHDLAYDSIIKLEENRLQFPGVFTATEPKRFYRDSVNSPHIFGSLGEVTQQEQKQNSQYDQGDIVGKTALEKFYDYDLRGAKGSDYYRVDASGRELGMFNEQRNIANVHGSDIYLYMDYRLQQVAESLMVNYRGSLVALDTRTGGVLALVSKPDYDPRDLTGKIDPEKWNALLGDIGKPLYSRAIQSLYPPGSTYKIVASLAAFQEGIIDDRWSVHCPGYFKLGRKTIRCWNAGGHGKVNVYGAIKGSCNVYFYQLGLKIGLDTWSKYSTLFAFGQKTGIDLPSEKPGLVPTTAFFNRRYGKNGWTKGNLANLAIGQGELLVTPLQIAQFAMILANKGTYYKPHLVDYLSSHLTGVPTYISPPKQEIKGIDPQFYDIVREGMRQVMDGGTGWLGKVHKIEMAGKTGTAQNPHGDSHAWFMTFAPYKNPEIAVSVIVENGGGGGAVAAPIARKFLEMYFYNKISPPRPIMQAKPAEELTIEPINLDNFLPVQMGTEELINTDN